MFRAGGVATLHGQSALLVLSVDSSREHPMSEQPGKAAGTAEPNEPPSTLNFNKPWSIYPARPLCIRDAIGRPLDIAPDHLKIEHVRHIVACVNFCSDLDSEMLEAVTGGHYTISVQRVEPQSPPSVGEQLAVTPISDGFRAKLDEARQQFMRDIRNGRATFDGVLAGGAI